MSAHSRNHFWNVHNESFFKRLLLWDNMRVSHGMQVSHGIAHQKKTTTKQTTNFAIDNVDLKTALCCCILTLQFSIIMPHNGIDLHNLIKMKYNKEGANKWNNSGAWLKYDENHKAIATTKAKIVKFMIDSMIKFACDCIWKPKDAKCFKHLTNWPNWYRLRYSIICFRYALDVHSSKNR